ncbi:MAG: TIR domain-containing protein, partial [Crocinitomicaceae bacterium]
MSTPKHKVFLSFHSEDIFCKNELEALFQDSADVIISRSMKEGDISDQLKTETIRQKIRDEYLRESTVTIVL